MAERPKIGELLVAAGVIDTPALEAALEKQRTHGGRLGKILLGMGVLDEGMLVRTVARQLDMPVAWLKGKQVKASVLAKLPGHLARKHHCLPVMLDRKGPETLLIAMEDPSDATALDEVAIAAGCPVRVVLAAPTELEEALARHYPATREPEPAPAPVPVQASAPEPESGPELAASEPAPAQGLAEPDPDAGEPPLEGDDEPELLLTDSVGSDGPDPGDTAPELRRPPRAEPGELAPAAVAPEPASASEPDLASDSDSDSDPDPDLDLGAGSDLDLDSDADSEPAPEIGSYRASGLDLGLPDEPSAPLDSDDDLGLDLGSDADPAPELDPSPRRGVPYAGDSLDDAIDEVRGAHFDPDLPREAPRPAEPNSEDVGESLFPDDPLEMTVAPPRAPALASPPASSAVPEQARPRDPELRAVVELLIERGLLDGDELAARLLASRNATES